MASGGDRKQQGQADAKDSVIKEGKAEIFQPSSVFYNPVQEFNRDLTIAVISQFAKEHLAWVKERQAKQRPSQSATAPQGEGLAACGVLGEEHAQGSQEESGEEAAPQAGVPHPQGLRIMEGLAASGLRSIRFAQEIPGVKEVVANDFDSNAVDYIRRNIQHNQVSELVRESLGDASMVMYENRAPADRFDVIDLDPYGSPAHFLDAAVRSIRNGGLLCVTCTDMGPLCGSGPEACHSKYGSFALKGKFCHEAALRIILRSIESHANRYSRYIEPVIALKADFYIRVFVRVQTGQQKVKDSVTKLSMVYHCGGCGAFHLQPLATKTVTDAGGSRYQGSQGPPVGERCAQCHSHHRLGGPLWTAPLHDTDFIQRLLAGLEEADGERFGTTARMRGVLTMMTEELADVPLYYVTDDLFQSVHTSLPKYTQIRSAILHAGYRVSDSHCTKNAVKTDAPVSVLFDIVRCWAKEHPPNPKRVTEGSVTKHILDRPCSIEADFSPHAMAEPASRANNLLRFQENPSRDWGPKPRAKRSGGETLEERRGRGQSKKAKKDSNVDFKQFPCKRHLADTCELTEDTCKYSHSCTDTQTDAATSARTDEEHTNTVTGDCMEACEDVTDADRGNNANSDVNTENVRNSNGENNSTCVK